MIKVLLCLEPTDPNTHPRIYAVNPSTKCVSPENCPASFFLSISLPPFWLRCYLFSPSYFITSYNWLLYILLFDMGCGGSKQRSGGHAAPRPTSVPLQNVAAPSARNTHHQQAPHRTERAMTPQIRAEFLDAAARAFGRLEYGVIGGTALAQYGNRRTTSDLDVMVPHSIIDVVEEHLLQHGMVRTAGRGLG